MYEFVRSSIGLGVSWWVKIMQNFSNMPHLKFYRSTNFAGAIRIFVTRWRLDVRFCYWSHSIQRIELSPNVCKKHSIRLSISRYEAFRICPKSGFSDVIQTSVSQKRLMVHFWKCQRSTLRIVISQNACKSHSIRMSFRSYETFGICRKSDLPVRSRTLTGVIRTSSTTDMDVIR